jgi:hypothetical protein
VGSKISIGVGAVVGVILMVIALWAWQSGPGLGVESDKPDLVVWAVRAAAVAAAALGQTVLLVMVVGNVYRTRMADVALRVMTGAVFAVSAVSAIALGIAGH